MPAHHCHLASWHDEPDATGQSRRLMSRNTYR